ncbi:hypothetical protein IV203_013313 [Nitzschia inconspicua]|uniref:Uncharacterized protein n=1 Tax=Nitzschia inconspicua TaxID=303405 RepID=A0A9K3Q7Z0_9STRA|nr:hypothetical protein IV203_013313 [Nitzschia inconspicua]
MIGKASMTLTGFENRSWGVNTCPPRTNRPMLHKVDTVVHISTVAHPKLPFWKYLPCTLAFGESPHVIGSCPGRARSHRPGMFQFVGIGNVLSRFDVLESIITNIGWGRNVGNREVLSETELGGGNRCPVLA